MGMFNDGVNGSQRTITVSKNRLIETLTANRERHTETYKQAYEGYQRVCLIAVEALLAGTRSMEAYDERDGGRLNVDRLFQVVHGLPHDHTSHYDEALDMLSWHEGDTVEITPKEFRSYVRDEWDWSNQFNVSASRYTGGC